MRGIRERKVLTNGVEILSVNVERQKPVQIEVMGLWSRNPDLAIPLVDLFFVTSSFSYDRSSVLSS